MNFSKSAVAIALLMATSLRSASSFATPSMFGVAARRGAAGNGAARLFLFDKLFSTASGKLPVMADEAVMNEKAHGTSEKPVQKNLRWSCDYETADRICNFNRHYAEVSCKDDGVNSMLRLLREPERQPILCCLKLSSRFCFFAHSNNATKVFGILANDRLLEVH